MFINLNMKLVMHYSEKAESAFEANLRKISCALKAERDVGNRRGRWGAGPSHFFANQIPYLKKGSRLCPQYYCSPPLDFQTFRHLYLFSHGYRSQPCELKSSCLAEWARMAASYLHLPSKSHRGIAKIFAQVNSLQKIIAKTAIRSQKDFFSYYSYPYTNRELLPRPENINKVGISSIAQNLKNIVPYHKRNNHKVCDYFSLTITKNIPSAQHFTV